MSKANKFYLIDGHNLIPKVPGLGLEMLDDEPRLVELLQVFCQLRRRTIEVFFDRAPIGRAGKTRAGRVTVHAVRTGLIADDAIINRLRQLGKAARNCTVISSDRRVQVEARALQALVISSDEFAEQLLQARQEAEMKRKSSSQKLDEIEVDEWLRLFKESGKGK